MRKLSPAEVRRICKPEELPPFDEVVPTSCLGQERAAAAIDLALAMEDDLHNIFVVGAPETGKTNLVLNKLQEVTTNRRVPPDWIYVKDFDNGSLAKAISLPPGKAKSFKADMRAAILYLLNILNLEKKIMEAADRKHKKFIEPFQQRLTQFNLKWGSRKKKTPQAPWENGIWYKNPYNDNDWVGPDELERLDFLNDEKRAEIREKINWATSYYKITLASRLEKIDIQTNMTLNNENLIRKLKEKFLVKALKKLKDKYGPAEKTLQFLNKVENDIRVHLGWFDLSLPSEMFKNGVCMGCMQAGVNDCPLHGSRGEFARYDIAIVQDNSSGAVPIVIVPTPEIKKPTYPSLFGEAVGEMMPGGGLRFTHTMISPGACHRANGGYLIVKVNELLPQPMALFIIQELVDTIKNKAIGIEDAPALLGMAYPMGKMPQKAESIPLNLRLILVGDEMQYHTLRQVEGILHLFRILKLKAQMEPDMPRTAETVRQLDEFIKFYCLRKKFLMPDLEARAELIDHASCCAQHQEKLTLRRQEIKLVLGEANFFAEQRNGVNIQRQDIEKALEEKRRQLDWVEERMQAHIKDKAIKIDTEGKENGQINALGVHSTGDHTFGLPYRITANVFLGKGDIVSIDREATLALEIHNKGLGILTGYFKETFGQNFPLAFGASLVFEQAYGKIDGDSASSPELYALLSKFAGAPIKQAIAVTGSVNQRGEVQLIGGVNHKIAGWFKTCKARGLTGEQSVLIPEANAKDLMLDKEIVEAVREGKFHIWTAGHISEGIELLTDLPFGGEDFEGDCIYKRVEKRLRQMAESVRNFMKPIEA